MKKTTISILTLIICIAFSILVFLAIQESDPTNKFYRNLILAILSSIFTLPLIYIFISSAFEKQ